MQIDSGLSLSMLAFAAASVWVSAVRNFSIESLTTSGSGSLLHGQESVDASVKGTSSTLFG